MDSKDTDLIKAVGRLEGQVETLVEIHRDEQKHAREHRERLYKGLTELSDKLITIETRVTNAEEAVRKVEPVISKLTRWEQRGIGAVAVIAVFGGLLISAVSFALKLLWEKLYAAW